MKRCNRCKQEKSLDNFHRSKNSKDGKGGRCKQCSSEYNKEWQAKDPVRARESWMKSYKKTYDAEKIKARRHGLTMVEYNQLVDQKNGKCWICDEVPTGYLNVDHDHVTGKVRGMLCLGCNTALGSLKDRVDLLEKAIKYLSP